MSELAALGDDYWQAVVEASDTALAGVAAVRSGLWPVWGAKCRQADWESPYRGTVRLSDVRRRRLGWAAAYRILSVENPGLTTSIPPVRTFVFNTEHRSLQVMATGLADIMRWHREHEEPMRTEPTPEEYAILLDELRRGAQVRSDGAE